MGTNKHLDISKQDNKSAKPNKHSRYRRAENIDDIIMLNYPALYMLAERMKKINSVDVNK